MKLRNVLAILALMAITALAVSQVLLPGSDGALESASKAELMMLTRECDSCHGPNGISAAPDTPSLAGLPVERFIEAVHRFSFYERHCPNVRPRFGGPDTSNMNMCTIAGGINQQQVEALAEYYARQPGSLKNSRQD